MCPPCFQKASVVLLGTSRALYNFPPYHHACIPLTQLEVCAVLPSSSSCATPLMPHVSWGPRLPLCLLQLGKFMPTYTTEPRSEGPSQTSAVHSPMNEPREELDHVPLMALLSHSGTVNSSKSSLVIFLSSLPGLGPVDKEQACPEARRKSAVASV